MMIVAVLVAVEETTTAVDLEVVEMMIAAASVVAEMMTGAVLAAVEEKTTEAGLEVAEMMASADAAAIVISVADQTTVILVDEMIAISEARIAMVRHVIVVVLEVAAPGVRLPVMNHVVPPLMMVAVGDVTHQRNDQNQLESQSHLGPGEKVVSSGMVRHPQERMIHLQDQMTDQDRHRVQEEVQIQAGQLLQRNNVFPSAIFNYFTFISFL